MVEFVGNWRLLLGLLGDLFVTVIVVFVGVAMRVLVFVDKIIFFPHQ